MAQPINYENLTLEQVESIDNNNPILTESINEESQTVLKDNNVKSFEENVFTKLFSKDPDFLDSINEKPLRDYSTMNSSDKITALRNDVSLCVIKLAYLEHVRQITFQMIQKMTINEKRQVLTQNANVKPFNESGLIKLFNEKTSDCIVGFDVAKIKTFLQDIKLYYQDLDFLNFINEKPLQDYSTMNLEDKFIALRKDFILCVKKLAYIEHVRETIFQMFKEMRQIKQSDI